VLTAHKCKTGIAAIDTYYGPVTAPIAGDPLQGALLEGRYRVQSPIAAGGMSMVYRGLDTRLDRPVALKVMDARYAGDERFLTRFRLEARAAARLADPTLVAVYDQGVDGRHPYLVMELVEGGTLRELLAERGPMPPHAVVAVLRPVLRGLAAAHRAGLVHRDIKPENVLISDDGAVKLADFGLVRAVAQAGITSASVILGTAAYLSPEQVSAGVTDSRSDVYSVGILTYELLTGTTPFMCDTPLATAYSRVEGDVPAPSEAIDGVPAQFDGLVLRASARDPDARYSDAAAMAATVDAIAEELSLPPFRVPAPRNSAQHAAAERDQRRPHTAPVPVNRQRVAPPTSAAQATNPPSNPAAAHRPTRAMTRGPDDWRGSGAPHDTPGDGLGEDGVPEFMTPARRFAGIDITEFAWARQRARRVTALWVVAVLLLTGAVAATAWVLGSNMTGLIR
jgi:serine/threonine protein kinase, bacterial